MQCPEAHWNSSAPQSRSTAPSAPPSLVCWQPISSDMSEQSGSPSHRHSFGKQAPLPHLCCDGGHVRDNKTEQSRSSAPPSQSGSPSHTQTCGIQLPLLGHRNELVVQFRLTSKCEQKTKENNINMKLLFPVESIKNVNSLSDFRDLQLLFTFPAHALCSSCRQNETTALHRETIVKWHYGVWCGLCSG